MVVLLKNFWVGLSKAQRLVTQHKVGRGDVPDVCEPNCDGMCRAIGYCPRRRQRLRGEAKTGAEPEKEKSDETEDGDTNNGRSR